MKEKAANTPKKKSVSPKLAAPPSIVDEARSFCSEMRQLVLAKEAAETLRRKREQALGDSRKALAESQSSALVKNPNIDLDGLDSPESQAFVRATMELEQAKAALSGVGRKIAQHDIEILVLAEKLKFERESHNQKALASFTDRIWQPARQAYAHVLRLAAALAAALGQPVPDAGTLPDAGPWDEDPEAVALHNANNELRKLATDLDSFRIDAERRVRADEAEKRLLARAPFNTDAGVRYRVRVPFVAYGKNFVRGEEITTSEVPIGLLSKLHAAGRVVIASTEEF